MTTRTVSVVDLKKCFVPILHIAGFSEKRTQEFHAEPGPFCQTQQQEALSETNAEGLWGTERKWENYHKVPSERKKHGYVKLVDDMLREIDQDFLD